MLETREGWGLPVFGVVELSLGFDCSSDGVIWLLGLGWLAELAHIPFYTGTDGSPVFIGCLF